jgi:spore germination protein KC
MKNYVTLGIAAVIVFLSGFGCFPHTELSQRLIVQSLGFDYDKDKGLFTVTVSFLPVSSEQGNESGGAGGGSVATSSGKGLNLSGAIADTELNSGKKLMLGECRVLVLGEGMRNKSLFDIAGIFTNEYENHPKMLVVSSRGKASDIISMKHKDSDVSNQKISRLIEEASVQGLANKTTLFTMLVDLYCITGSTGMPLIAAEGSGDDKTVKLLGGTLYRDGKFVSETTPFETSGLQWLRNECSSSAKIVIPIDDLETTVDLKRVKTRLYPSVTEDGILRVFVSFKADAEYIEHHIDPETMKNAEKVEKVIRQVVAERLTAAFSKSVNSNSSDVIGLSRASCSKVYNFFRTNENNWNNVLKNAEIVVDPKITVNRHGVVW